MTEIVYSVVAALGHCCAWPQANLSILLLFNLSSIICFLIISQYVSECVIYGPAR